MPHGNISTLEHIGTRLHRFGAATPSGSIDGVVRRAGFAAWMTLNVAAHPNSAGHRLRAATNLWAWQLWRRTVNKPVVVEFGTGAKLRCPPWSRIAGAWVSIGYHEEELLFVVDTLRPGEGFIDVGANIGVYSVVAASVGGRIAGFEPVNQPREAFEQNVALNAAKDRVRIFGCALSDVRGTASITQNLDNQNHLLAEGAADDEGATEVDVERLDDVVTSLGEFFSEGVAMVKIDAEGFDLQVLRGSLRTLERYKPSVIIEVWDGIEIRTLLESAGYSIFHYDAQMRQLLPIAEDFRGEGYFVAVHQTKVAETRRRVAASKRSDRGPRVHWTAGF